MAMIGVHVTRELKTVIDRIADEKEMSTAALVRSVLKGWLRAREKAEVDARRAQENSVWPLSQPRTVAGGAR